MIRLEELALSFAGGKPISVQAVLVAVGTAQPILGGAAQQVRMLLSPLHLLCGRIFCADRCSHTCIMYLQDGISTCLRVLRFLTILRLRFAGPSPVLGGVACVLAGVRSSSAGRLLCGLMGL